MAKYVPKKEVPGFRWSAETGKLFKWLPSESKELVYSRFYQWFTVARKRNAGIIQPDLTGLTEQESDVLVSMCADAAEGIASYWNMCDMNRENRNASRVDDGATDGRPQVDQRKNERMNERKNDRESSAVAPPTVDDVRSYASGKELKDDAERFVAYYSMNGWRHRGEAMTDWRAAYQLWLMRGEQYEYRQRKKLSEQDNDQRQYDEKKMRAIVGADDLYEECNDGDE